MDDRRGPGRPRQAETDAAITAAALDLLIERGVDAVGIEQVARLAGVTRATVYRRFPDRIALLIAAITAGHEAPAGVPDDLEFGQLLTLLAEHLSDSRHRRLARRLMTALQDQPELRDAYLETGIRPREQAIRATLARARDAGRFPPGTDLAVIATILTGAVAVHLTSHPDDSTPRQIEEFLLGVMRQTGYQEGS
ncbi:AcrR family transcriptional regulator [Allocatelliglobosispora scoriae]|uniref:AcrR family transcriptional regulator n=1 Tax=Allocatelliglobosispora scoriae TaxID=643052 RepID=A0A841BQQ2_9ACTN|nr:TetR/AcrR family transcriptional regulator [Allocatelliglobosispora scoriae]MBB5869151.1 AcrR family transcriptional regulator [Allocatelliglobosispora scoriae]